MPSSVRNAALLAGPVALEAASAATRSTARAPRTVSRAIAASRLTASAEARSVTSASICLEEEALMATAESENYEIVSSASRLGPTTHAMTMLRR